MFQEKWYHQKLSQSVKSRQRDFLKPMDEAGLCDSPVEQASNRVEQISQENC